MAIKIAFLNLKSVTYSCKQLQKVQSIEQNLKRKHTTSLCESGKNEPGTKLGRYETIAKCGIREISITQLVD